MSDEDTNEVIDPTNDETEEVFNTEVVEETVVDTETEDEQPKYTEAEMKLYARAKKAEAEAREAKRLLKEKEAKQTINKQDSKTDNASEVDEKILRATKGYGDDAIEELKFIAERNNISLFAAETDKRFVRYMKIVEEEKRSQEASLGASKGASRKNTPPSFGDPNLTPEQHKELAAKYGIK